MDGWALIIFLKALSDSLDKADKMFNFGVKAISHFIFSKDLNIPNEFYKLLFTNEWYRES